MGGRLGWVRTYVSFPVQVRVPVSDFGFIEENRGGLGISSKHVHDIAWSCNTPGKGVQLFRYKQVELVRVPAHALEAWRAANKLKCESDALMPRFSPTMTKALLAKTHFGHGLKLRADGNRTLFNDNKTPIKVQAEREGSEDMAIREAGVLASIYSSQLWEDPEAMQALMQADNDDAEVELGEDEVQAQGRVESALQVLASGGNRSPKDSEVLQTMQQAGLRAFSSEHTLCLIHFRLSLTLPVANLFRSLVFLSVNGRVGVSPLDYECVATLDVRCQWTGWGVGQGKGKPQDDQSLSCFRRPALKARVVVDDRRLNEFSATHT